MKYFVFVLLLKSIDRKDREEESERETEAERGMKTERRMLTKLLELLLVEK